MFPLNVTAALGGESAVSVGVIRATDTGGLFAEGNVKFTINPAPAGALPFPRIGSVLYSREEAEDSANGVRWREEIAKLDCVVLGLFPKGDWDSTTPTGLSRQEVYNDLIARNPNLYIFDYTSVMEFSTSQAVQQELQDWVEGEVAWTGSVPPGWPNKNFYARTPGGSTINTFGADPNVLNVNICKGAGYPDGTDSSGRQYPEFYGDHILQYMLDSVNTPKNGQPGSVGIFHDVMDAGGKTNSGDWNADGSSESARSNWNNTGDPTAMATATAWRAGHRAYEDRLDASHPGILSMGNWTAHLTNAYPGDPENDANNSWVGTDLSRLPLQISSYYQQNGAAYIENQNQGDFPESGVKADGTQAGPGSWQRVHNRNVQAMRATKAPHIVGFDWKAECTPNAGSNPDLFTPTGGPFHVMRWGLATTLMQDGYYFPHFSQNTFRNIMWIDELGITNTGTTGLFKGWGGLPIDAPQVAPRQGSNIYWREFANMLAIVNTGTNFSGSATTVIVANLPGGAGAWRRINGSQDSTHNDGSVVNANFSLNQADGIILQRV